MHIPDNWMIANIQLSLFNILERTNHKMSIQNYRFVPKDTDFRNSSLHSYLEGDRTKLDFKINESNLLFSPSGVFYSIDEFFLNGITFSDNGIQIIIDYINTENQDVEPFYVVPVFLISLNNTITKCRNLIVSFNSVKKDFYTSNISEHPNANIPSIRIDF